MRTAGIYCRLKVYASMTKTLACRVIILFASSFVAGVGHADSKFVKSTIDGPRGQLLAVIEILQALQLNLVSGG